MCKSKAEGGERCAGNIERELAELQKEILLKNREQHQARERVQRIEKSAEGLFARLGAPSRSLEQAREELHVATQEKDALSQKFMDVKKEYMAGPAGVRAYVHQILQAEDAETIGDVLDKFESSNAERLRMNYANVADAPLEQVAANSKRIREMSEKLNTAKEYVAALDEQLALLDAAMEANEDEESPWDHGEVTYVAADLHTPQTLTEPVDKTRPEYAEYRDLTLRESKKKREELAQCKTAAEEETAHLVDKARSLRYENQRLLKQASAQEELMDDEMCARDRDEQTRLYQRRIVTAQARLTKASERTERAESALTEINTTERWDLNDSEVALEKERLSKEVNDAKIDETLARLAVRRMPPTLEFAEGFYAQSDAIRKRSDKARNKILETLTEKASHVEKSPTPGRIFLAAEEAQKIRALRDKHQQSPAGTPAW